MIILIFLQLVSNMDTFEKNLLNKLLDKYESSKLSKGGTAISRCIKLTTKDDVLSSYGRSDSYKYADENDSIIKKLAELGFIKAEWNFDSFKSLTLVIENVDLVYAYLNRAKPADELERIKTVLSKYSFDNFLEDFIEYVNNYINTRYDYPKSYFADSMQLDLLLKTFTGLFKLEKDTKKRDFSVKYLGDSKIFESIQGKIIKIIKSFDPNEYESDEEVLAAYNIVKNTSYAIIKNKLCFRLNNCVINLDELGFEYSLSDEMINNLSIIPSNIYKVITVENLTSFYSLDDKDALIIYLAGFHNHTKQNLLKLIYNAYPHAEYFHFSDIDAGGFWIYHSLKEKTNIPFTPYRMNVEELVNHKDHLKKLTENDKNRLSKMINDNRFDVFKETIEYMLANNVKLEQEILD